MAQQYLLIDYAIMVHGESFGIDNRLVNIIYADHYNKYFGKSDSFGIK